MSKRVPTHTPETGTPEYWVSLDHLAEKPEVRAMIEREFPEGASTIDAPTRRTFLTLMSASFAMMGLTGCIRRPEEHIIPYQKMPEGVIPGIPQFYATNLAQHGEAIGVLIESHEGRPTKLEGNPDHPASLGGASPWMQAAVLDLYDPDRVQAFFRDGKPVSGEDAMKALADNAAGHEKDGGARLRVLRESTSSPTTARLEAAFAKRFPKAKIHAYDAVSQHETRAGSKLAFGDVLRGSIAYDRARAILAVDADFLGTEPGAVLATKLFSRNRKVIRPTDRMSRLWVAEPGYTVTGMNADHRARIPASAAEDVLLALAAELGKKGVDLKGIKGRPSAVVDAKWLATAAKDLIENRGASVVVVGSRQPASTQALAHAINDGIGALGRIVRFVKAPVTSGDPADLKALVDDMGKGAVDTLVVLGGNPAYSAPGDVDFAGAFAKVPNRFVLASHHDETSTKAGWVLPRAHDLETWNDLRALDGSLCLQQPMIAPIFDGRTDAEVMAALVKSPETRAHDLVRATFRELTPGAPANWNELHDKPWRRALHDGVLRTMAAGPVEAKVDYDAVAKAVGKAAPSLSPQALEVTFAPDDAIVDGRFANVAWLMELPHAITKTVWDNVAWISPKTATDLNLESGEVVRLSVAGRTVDIPVWIVPGTADNSVQLHLGWGRKMIGRVGDGKGFNVGPLRSAAALGFATGAKLDKTGNSYVVVVTQEHNMLEGRPIIQENTLDGFRADPKFTDKAVVHPPLLPLWEERKYEGYKWGMVIDLNACTGCNACVVACQAENNVPTVGKEQVSRQREMHWLRIDRYFTGSVEEPKVLNQPMMCVHCENAPCENVCPVNATSHSPEGLNEMTYNRCIGTRYCSNNCPYKVRRFNFLDYHDDVPETIKMVANPNVTVRMRGVMEKCSYCSQRIQAAKINTKREGHRKLRDGEVVTACQQSCPADAITFGDLNDKNSRVARLSEAPHGFRVLEEINTKPRTTYIAKIRNPHPELA